MMPGALRVFAWSFLLGAFFWSAAQAGSGGRPKPPPRPAQAPASEFYYDQLLADGRLDIMVALGFEQKKSGIDTPVIGPIADAFYAPIRDTENTMRDVSNIEASILGCFQCGFTKVSEVKGLRVYTARIEYRFKPVEVRVRFIFAEPGAYRETLKKAFIDSLANDDVVMYLGHAREGRGFPDFASPLGDGGMIFSLHTIEGWKGFEKGLFSRTKYQILVLNACQTKRYYHEVIRQRVWEKPASRLALIMSDDDTWFEDYPSTTAALIQGLMFQRSRDELLEALNESADFYNSMHMMNPNKKILFVGDGLFDGTYEKAATPKRVEPNEPWRNMPF